MSPRTAAVVWLTAGLAACAPAGCAAGTGSGTGGDTSSPAGATADAGGGPGAPDAAGMVGSETATPGPPGSDGASPAAGEIRIYVAGESIEQFNRFNSAPFGPDGALIRPDDNGPDEYGWMVPFADRLKLRAPGTSVTWVGTEPWITRDYETSDGAYPATPGMSSALAGTSVADWLDQSRDQLEEKRFCYDVAFAVRGGNDAANDVPEATYKAGVRALVRLLDAGSSCRTHPLIWVVAHMPDSAGWGWDVEPAAIAAWVALQHTRYVAWNQDLVTELAAEIGPSIRLLDLHTPFMQQAPTTAFPSPTWLADGGPDLERLHVDGQHPKRLASIYAGEIAADGFDLAAVPGR